MEAVLTNEIDYVRLVAKILISKEKIEITERIILYT